MCLLWGRPFHSPSYRKGGRKMRRLLALAIMMTILSVQASAFESETKILTSDEIIKLSDKDLLDAYIDVSVEIEAAKSFHATSGFMPKEYKSFKDMLRYRILLINEMRKRKLDIPQTE